MNWQRIWSIAHHVFREGLRDRIVYLLPVYALALLGVSPLLRDVALGAEHKILLDLGLAALQFLGLVVAVFIGTNLIAKEIDKRTIFILMAKPLRRSELILGKQMGLGLLLLLIAVLMGLSYAGVLELQQVNPPWGSLVVAMVFIFLEWLVVVAAALLFGTFTTPILATLYTIAFYIVGHLSRSILELGRVTRSQAVGRFSELVYLILPDLDRLNLKNDAVYGSLPPAPELWEHGLYGILYMMLLLSLSILIFERRQF
jgi:ABC-type transport system involved in multi-copper enzyme maturation permease subunit